MLMIEVLVSSGTDTNRKKGLVAALIEKFGEAGVDPNDIVVFFWRPIARADHSVAAGSHRLLPSPDHRAALSFGKDGTRGRWFRADFRSVHSRESPLVKLMKSQWPERRLFTEARGVLAVHLGY